MLKYALLMFLPMAALADFQGATHMMPFEEDTISYNNAKDTGPIPKLQERMDKGEVVLKEDKDLGMLPALLDALGVPKSSQMLVFSKTSFQREKINPKNPRAIFFRDDVYVGYVPGSPLLEITSVDPKLGAVFYTFDESQKGKAKFRRTDQCLECHATAKTMGVPGHLVRSFQTDESGVVDITTGTSQVNHRTPFAERWGGWYVTGTHGNQVHRGNVMGASKTNVGNLTNLSAFVEMSSYPESGSDIVALMVLEHQTHMHNFITRLNYAGTIALQQYGHVNYLKSAIEGFIKYLLFAEEAPLKDPVAGTSSFAKEFAAQGPRDKKGRSLREFDLEERLFKYPCSYLIYSDAFEALPEKLKGRIYERLWEVLSGETESDYGHLTPRMKRDLIEILADTKHGLPPCWKKEDADKRVSLQ